MTTVYIDSIPYLIDMRVRVYDKLSGGENRLYYFTPEEVVTTKKIDTDLPTGKRRAFTEAQEEVSTFNITIPQAGDGVKVEGDQKGWSLPMAGGEWIDTFVPWPYNEEKGGTQHGGEEATAPALQGISGDVLRGKDFRSDTGGSRTYSETSRGIGEGKSEKRAADWAVGHIVEHPKSLAAIQAAEDARTYIPDVVIVEDSAIKGRNPTALALTSRGVIYLSDMIPQELVGVVSHHEAIHAVKQRGNTEYQMFLEHIGEGIDFKSVIATDVLEIIMNGRFEGRDLLE